MAVKTFKYRLYPSKSQRSTMQGVLDACCWVYNKTLETRKVAWKEQGKSLSLYDTIKMLPSWKAEHPWLKQAHSQVLQEACMRVDLAFKGFFRRVQSGEKPGYPRFKDHWYTSFAYPQSGFRLIKDNRLYLSKIGEVKIVLHRPIGGKVKRLTIKRDTLGNWYACFAVEFEPELLLPNRNIIGIDLGCKYFATFSTSEHIPNPRFFRQNEEALAKAQRKLSGCKKDTAKYNKWKRIIQHIHKHITNRRRDFAHKLSHRLVSEFQVIVFENLDIQNMQDGNWRSLNKSISDAAWGQLVRLTREKAEWAGRAVVTVDPRNTSRMCSGCGKLVPKGLSERVHRCPFCNLELDRDHNAALNILARGLASMGLDPKSPHFDSGGAVTEENARRESERCLAHDVTDV